MTQGEDHDPHEVGPLAEEAARFATAFASWAARNSAGVSQHAQDLATGLGQAAKETLHDVDEHFSTGSAECTVCPLCRAMALVRDVSPEVRDHLTQAATSLVAAASGLMATWNHAASPGRTSRPEPEGDGAEVETIDLDEAPE